MSDLRAWLARLTGFLRTLAGDRGARADAELREELETHLAMDIAAYVRRGMSPGEARRRALLAAGGLTLAAESVRERRGVPWADAVVTDLRYAVRTLRAQPGFSGAVLLTLALGIGATVAMFTILEAVILRPLPYPDPHRIVSLSLSDKGSDLEVVDDRSYDEWARASGAVEAMAVYSGTESVARTAAGPREIRGTLATPAYFDVLGVRPMMGRAFTGEEARPGGPAVVLLSEQLWRSDFAADPAILGKSVTMDGTPATIIGVMPASFTTARRAQFWAPYRIGPVREDVTLYYDVVARLRAGASIEALRAELETIQRRLDPRRPARSRGFEPVVMTLHERRYGSTRAPLLLLFAAVGVLLLVTCANLANLSLARTARREREMALRLALGAGRWRLARYVLLESLVLSAGGAVLGLVLAASSLGWFVRMSPRSVGNVEGIGVNAPVLWFTLGVAAVTGILFGLLPALAAGRTSLSRSLAAASTRAAGSRGQRTMRRSMVVLELATALVLIVGAGLVARTFWRVTSIEPGFDPRHVLTARLRLPRDAYSDAAAQGFLEELLSRVRRQPGVRSAALVDAVPLTGVRMSVQAATPGKEDLRFDVVGVTPSYFETMRTRIIEGRAIGPDDRAGSARSVVVDATLARLVSPAGSALGRKVPIAGDTATIVGVAEPVHQRQLEGALLPLAFVPLAQSGGWHYQSLVVRTEGPIEPLARAVTRMVQAMDPAQPPPRFRAMEDVVADVVAPRKFVFVLLAIFAALAGTLAAVGLYGVLAYLVAERTREIGVRMALGADPGRVMRVMLRQGMALVAAGIAIGLAVAAGAVRLLDTMLYEVGVYDARTFAGAMALLAAVSFLATYVPARRASRVDPVAALRAE